MKRLLVFHPFLFALFPVLSLFAANRGQLEFGDMIAPLAAVLGVTAGTFLLSLFIFKQKEQAAMIVSVAVLLFFSFGHVFSVLEAWQISDTRIGYRYLALTSRFLSTFWIVILGGAIVFFRKPRRTVWAMTKIANVTAAVLILLPLISLTRFEFREISSSVPLPATATENGSNTSVSTAPMPDIYYFILDRYASDRTLREVYGYDNSDFLNALEKRGFYVARESFANYSNTAQSLAASLNLRFLDFLTETMGRESSNWKPTYDLLKDHEVQRFLKERGYAFIQLGDWWKPTARNPYADRNYNLEGLSELSGQLYRTTMLAAVTSFDVANIRLSQWKRTRYKFEKIKEVAQISGPKFVFAHILLPHGPSVFDSDGSFLPAETAARRGREKNYVNQVIFANRKMQETLDALLGSEKKSIVILQADEGPYPRGYDATHYAAWEKANDAELKEKFGILNALYLPGVDQSKLYPSITPVNTFRLVFNEYFGTTYAFLPDQIFTFEDLNHLYTFFEVTDRVR